MAGTDTSPLDYERRRTRGRWRIHWRRWVIALGLLFAGVLLWRERPRIEYLLWRTRVERCIAQLREYEYPANHVVYESDPTQAAALLRSGAEYAPIYVPGTTTSPAAGSRPAELIELAHLIAGCRIEGANGRYMDWPSQGPWAVLYAGKLRTRAGDERLVVLYGHWTDLGGQHQFCVDGGSICPSFDQKPIYLASPPGLGGGIAVRTFSSARRLRIFAARVDPVDPCRLRLDFEVDGRPGTLYYVLDHDLLGPASP